MKHTKILVLAALMALGTGAQAQEETPKKKRSVSIGMDGVTVGPKDETEEDREDAQFLVTYGMVDLGFNRIDDKTDYSASSNALNELYQIGNGPNVLYAAPTAEPFKLRESKSINVNVWIVNTRLKIAGNDNQKLFFTSGIGLQMYNFRFDSRRMYASEPNTHLEYIPANLNVEKNKLGFTYAAIPVGLLAKTRITKNRWLVYGGSFTGGYRLASWTKLKTAQNGKEKNHDPFNFSDFNACVIAEVGIDNIFRLYGSYQLTPLSSGPLNQHPFALGIRFLGL